MRPLFSIGVTTYNRHQMLRECLESILCQSFTDYEVLVGNDYPDEELSSDLFDLDDSRIRFVNHPKNLGEIGNMNRLLAMSNGRYFTWLADDDMYEEKFFQKVHEALERSNFSPCVFTSYTTTEGFRSDLESSPESIKQLSGRHFLHQYLAREITTQGCYGVFDREYLSSIGGIQKMGKGFGPYSDCLLAVRVGLLEHVLYIDEPLIFFRMHDQSISYSSSDDKTYGSAQTDWLHESVQIFRAASLRADFDFNLHKMLIWCMDDYFGVIQRSRSFPVLRITAHMLLIMRYIFLLKKYRLRIFFGFFRNVAMGLLSVIRWVGRGVLWPFQKSCWIN